MHNYLYKIISLHPVTQLEAVLLLLAQSDIRHNNSWQHVTAGPSDYVATNSHMLFISRKNTELFTTVTSHGTCVAAVIH